MSHFEYDELSTDAKRSIQGIRGVEDSLKTLQKEYELAVFDLERKWSVKFSECYERRSALLSGTVAPTGEEIAVGETKSRRIRSDYQPLVALEDKAKAVPVENYWLHVFFNSHVDAYIAETDFTALRHLTNVSLSYPSQEELPMPAFRLGFCFSPNEFFKNAELELTLYYKAEVNFTGNLQFSHVTADKIDWMPDRNLIEIAAQNGDPQDPNDPGDESFFSIFEPPVLITVPAVEGANKDNEFDRSIALAHVFNFGLELKQMVLPNTVDYLLGEVEDDEDDDDEEWDDYESDSHI
ncbi:hypothetical protein BDZ94DRAFT_742005 [Collybia nuda]|uniref:Nucleosome assembly protein n=1 Tax=Collybia nuda TaxID=64659 RepID=A0A9P5Y4S3_9AGAR|nr:hypothetical protein BDZ94DRAFT_742005 [Collybia nuda]